MPARWFICPDEEKIEIGRCLSVRGCRMNHRCATMPYLRMCANQRPWKAVTPSQAGTGPRVTFLKQKCDYAISPDGMAWISVGVGTHDKLSIHRLVRGFVSEEGFSDDLIKGIPDLLEPDEEELGFYLLYDYKTWGSFKCAKALGIDEDKDNPITDKDGGPVTYRSGKRKGQIKYPLKPGMKPPEMYDTELQLNRYRIVVEKHGFPISRMNVYAIARDGNTYIATSRGIEKNTYLIPVKRLPDKGVLDFYSQLQADCDHAFETGMPRICTKFETWEGRRCQSDDYCPVRFYCKEMEKNKGILPKKHFSKAA